MNINPLIFSNAPKLRISRHVLFWSVWVLYDTVFAALGWSKYSFSAAFLPSFFTELLSFPLDIIFCYTIIYFLIPRFLYKGQYIEMIFLWLFFSMLYIICFRAYSNNVPPLIYNFYGMPYKPHPGSFLWDFFYLFSQINMEGCMAAAIKLGKMWFIKQQEAEVFNKEKKQTDFGGQLVIQRPQPVFLARALEKVGQFSYENPAVIPGMMENIQALFRYINFINNKSKASLVKELEMVKIYIDLEKQISGSKLSVHLKIPDVPNTKRIAPNILLPLVEHCFLHLSGSQRCNEFVSLDAAIHDSDFKMNIIWNKPIDIMGLATAEGYTLNTINNYLKLVYPGGHELKMMIKPAEISILLWLNLDRAINNV